MTCRECERIIATVLMQEMRVKERSRRNHLDITVVINVQAPTNSTE
jgi:hypothetical protein